MKRLSLFSLGRDACEEVWFHWLGAKKAICNCISQLQVLSLAYSLQ